jgi:hypothetical protein
MRPALNRFLLFLLLPAFPAIASAQKPKSYKEIITSNALTDAGLFTIHKVEDKYFFKFLISCREEICW